MQGLTNVCMLLQMLRQPSGNHDERVGGNTPLLDLEDPLLDGPMLGHSSANDSFLTGRLPSLEGECLHALPLSHALAHGADQMSQGSIAAFLSA